MTEKLTFRNALFAQFFLEVLFFSLASASRWSVATAQWKETLLIILGLRVHFLPLALGDKKGYK